MQKGNGRALRLEKARGPSAAAREGWGAERCGQRKGEGYKNEGRGGDQKSNTGKIPANDI